MRICFVCQSLATLGGVQRAVALLSNELVSRGEDVFVLMDSSDIGANPYGLSSSVSILDVGTIGPSEHFGRIASKLRRRLGFPRPLRRTRGLSESVIGKKNLMRVREAFAKGRFDAVVGCDPLHTIIAAYACDGLAAKVCGWQHSTYDGYFHQRGRGYYGLERLYIGSLVHCAVNFVLTEQSKKKYERDTGHSATVLPNAIAELGNLSSAEGCVLFCGRLDSGSKGADFIPQIAERLAAVGFTGRFLVVGDGPYRGSLERWLGSTNLPFDTELKGFVSNPEFYYEQATVLISPSRWEGFGLSILEAMAHGVPCVAFDNDGPRSLITNEVDGYIVPNGDVDGLVKKTMSLLFDKALHMRMAPAAAKTASGYLVCSQADRFLAVLKG